MTKIERLFYTSLAALLLLAMTPLQAAPNSEGNANGEVVEESFLRTDITVAGPFVTLGDIFHDAGDAATFRIARSPQPGRRGIIEVERIARAARANGILWMNREHIESVSVTRASKVIPSDQIAYAISDAVSLETGAPIDDIEVDLASPNFAIHLDVNQDPTLRVTNLSVDRRSGRFQALIVAPAEGDHRATTRITGRAYVVEEVPVLTRLIQKGQEIDESDVEMARVDAARLARGVIRDPSELIGMAPKRVAQPGQPIRASDIRKPVLVSKNALVTMVYQAEGMMLTADGRALDDGARGDVIDIMNTRTKRTIQARVISANEVEVPRKNNVIAAR